MKKVILRLEKDESKTSISISALDSFGNSIPAFGSIQKIRAFGSRLFIPNDLTEEIEIIIESE
jgi:hypothetical protein